jgi:hypothetical protein
LNIRAIFGQYAVLIEYSTKAVVPLNSEGYPCTPLKLRARYVVELNMHGSNSPKQIRKPRFRPWPLPLAKSQVRPDSPRPTQSLTSPFSSRPSTPPCSPPDSPVPAISKSISLSTIFESKSFHGDDPEARASLLGPTQEATSVN